MSNGLRRTQRVPEFCIPMSKARGIKIAFPLTAERAPDPISFAEVVERAAQSHGRTYEQVRADTRVLTRTVRRVFHRSLPDANWPVEFIWGINGDSQRYYRMAEDVARRVCGKAGLSSSAIASCWETDNTVSTAKAVRTIVRTARSICGMSRWRQWDVGLQSGVEALS